MKKVLLIVLFFYSFQSYAQEYQLAGNEVKISKTIEFATGTAKLNSESNAALEIIKQYLSEKSYISLLRVECHTDNSGNAAKSQLLSEQRALAVCKKLTEMGVDCKRLIAVGFGGTKPVAGNDTVAGKAANRRVVFINAAIRNRPIGGMPVDGGGAVAGDVCN